MGGFARQSSGIIFSHSRISFFCVRYAFGDIVLFYFVINIIFMFDDRFDSAAEMIKKKTGGHLYLPSLRT